ncbi:MAG: hypothetical protein K6T88_08045, partial [Bacillus sp. (in: Bacteria)]|nr:hypothetical protein [Bacillus sp. (in: firmicutes)]
MKTYLPYLILTILLTGVLTGFQRSFSTIETEQKIGTMGQSKLNLTGLFRINNQNSKEIPLLEVKHEIKGNLVLIECIVTGISFREFDNSKQKIGKIVVWIDGKKNTEAASAAFIIKGLKPGSHKVMVEMVNLNDEPYG